jgi:hypothetical protein
MAVTGYSGLVAVSVLQAIQGLAPADLTPASGIVLLASAVSLVFSSVAALARIRLSGVPGAGHGTR